MTGKPFLLDRLMRRYTEILLARRIWFAAGAFLLVATAASFIPRVTFDNTPDSFFLQEDPTLGIYERFKQLFASDEYSLIVFEAPEQWTPDFIERVRTLQGELARLDNVRKATAITNVRFIEGDESSINVGDYLPTGLDTAELARKRAAAMVHPYYSDLFISPDGRHLGIIVETDIIKGKVDYKVVLTQRIRSLLERPPYDAWQARIVGAPILDADVRNIVSRESAMFGAIVFVLVGLGFLYVFRSLIGIVLPLGIALCSIVVAFGIMGMIGAPVGLLTPIIPSFLISVGVGTCIFLMTRIYSAIAEGQAVRAAIVDSMRVAGIPGMMAAVTTSAALLAFSSSRIAPVQDIGIVMGLALLAALVLTLVFVPITFSLFKTIPNSDRRTQLIVGRVEVLSRLCEFVLRRPTKILIAVGVVLAVALVGMSRINSDYYYLGNFKESTPIRQDYKAVDSTIRASSAIEMLVRGPGIDSFKEPRMLEALARLQEFADNYSAIPTKTYSLSSVVKEINQALHDGDPAFYRIPDSRPAVAQALLLFESSGSDELKNVVSPDYDIARLTIRVPTLPDSHYKPLIEGIQSFAARTFDRDLMVSVGAPGGSVVDAVTVTGLVPMWVKISEYLTQSQINSLMISVAVVTMVMMVMFRSVLLGVLMSGANTVVVALVLGMMGFAGISLDPYTILIAAIALGILDDDTIHFVKHVQHGVDHGMSLPDAIRDSFRGAGQAMFYTSGVLILSFAVYSLSDVASLGKFGLLISLTLMLGLLVEYLVTPSLLLTIDRLGLFKSRAADLATGEISHVDVS